MLMVLQHFGSQLVLIFTIPFLLRKLPGMMQIICRYECPCLEIEEASSTKQWSCLDIVPSPAILHSHGVKLS